MRLMIRLLAVAAMASPACGQSLFRKPPPARGDGVEAAPGTRYSMFVVIPPQPRRWAKHDLVTIIIDEITRQESEQKLETEKSYEMQSRIRALLDLQKLLELQLRAGGINNLSVLGLDHDSSFDGSGKYERKDRFTAKLTAEVIDVKPNGTLVLEARQHIAKNEEVASIVLSGTCRPEDITDNNSILSSQIANLTLISRTEGQLAESARKGLIPRVLETLLAF